MKKSDNPTGEYIIKKSRGFHDKLFLGSSFDQNYFTGSYFHILSCSCQDYEQYKHKEDFSGPVLLAKYVIAIKAVEKYAEEKGLKIITEDLGSDPMDHYRDEHIANPPSYLERKIVKLSDKPEALRNTLILRSIDLNNAAYNCGLCGFFNIGVPVKREDLFNFIIDSIKTPANLSSWKEFREELLNINTDKGLEMKEEMLAGFGFTKDDMILFR